MIIVTGDDAYKSKPSGMCESCDLSHKNPPGCRVVSAEKAAARIPAQPAAVLQDRGSGPKDSGDCIRLVDISINWLLYVDQYPGK
jgi:hypothetical protein